MNLTRGEVFLLIAGVIICCLLIFTEIQSAGQIETWLGESNDFPQHDPLWQMYTLAQKDDFALTSWQQIWKAKLTAEEEQRLLAWIGQDEQFLLTKSALEDSLHLGHLERLLWEKESEGTRHQIELLRYLEQPPHSAEPKRLRRQAQADRLLQSEAKSFFIYTWRASDLATFEHYQTNRETLSSEWDQQKRRIEEQLAHIVDRLPQNFACLEGFTNDKLDHRLSTKLNWWTEALNGQMLEQINDGQAISVTSYIPAWQQYIAHGENKLNLQLSLRYNALEERTRLTVGYPLIITEH